MIKYLAKLNSNYANYTSRSLNMFSVTIGYKV